MWGSVLSGFGGGDSGVLDRCRVVFSAVLEMGVVVGFWVGVGSVLGGFRGGGCGAAGWVLC